MTVFRIKWQFHTIVKLFDRQSFFNFHGKAIIKDEKHSQQSDLRKKKNETTNPFSGQFKNSFVMYRNPINLYKPLPVLRRSYWRHTCRVC